jgi:nucleotide-binding universal stress UspA family protein
MSDTNEATRGRIVVGIDGSEPSKRALAWAAHQAAMGGSELEVIGAWQYPTTYGWVVSLPSNLDLSEGTKTMIASTVAEVLGDPPAVKPIETVAEGHPTVVLLDASSSADLLVVGCRGLGAVRGALIGSVSAYLASHAHCPVVVVHDEAHDHHGHHEHGAGSKAAGA